MWLDIWYYLIALMVSVISPASLLFQTQPTEGDQIEMVWKESLTVGGCCQIEINDQYIQVMTFMSYLWHNNTGNSDTPKKIIMFYFICSLKLYFFGFRHQNYMFTYPIVHFGKRILGLKNQTIKQSDPFFPCSCLWTNPLLVISVDNV